MLLGAFCFKKDSYYFPLSRFMGTGLVLVTACLNLSGYPGTKDELRDLACFSENLYNELRDRFTLHGIRVPKLIPVE